MTKFYIIGLEIIENMENTSKKQEGKYQFLLNFIILQKIEIKGDDYE